MKPENPKLSSIILSDRVGLYRDMPINVVEKSDERFPFLDYSTLAYEVFREADETVTLICPHLLNLWPTLRDGLQQNTTGKPLKIHRKTFTKWDKISFHLPKNIEVLKFSEPDGEASEIPISPRSNTFEGTNALLTVLKDENPDWIVDWINYHKIHHNANAALIFNNNSSIYSGDELTQILKKKCKLEQIVVIDAPFLMEVDWLNLV